MDWDLDGKLLFCHESLLRNNINNNNDNSSNNNNINEKEVCSMNSDV